MTNQLENMTWIDVRDKVKDRDTILVPIGSVEVEGPHLPLGVDSIVAGHVANAVAAQTGLVVAPLIPASYSEWHKRFPGTITIKMETMLEVLRQYCHCLIACGFKRFLFINTHVGNDTPIFVLGTELRDQTGILVGMVNLWQMANEAAKNMPLDEKVFLHAGEIMTSVMLAIRPDLVDMQKAVAEYVQSGSDALTQKGSYSAVHKNHTYFMYRFSDESTSSGTMGDPSKASAEKGRLIIDHWVTNIVSFVHEFEKAV